MSKFYDDLLRGDAMKVLVRALLEKSGYLVCPYGYESSYSHITKKLQEKGALNTPTARRLKATPDLLVFDEQRKEAMLVEVKMRNAPDETSLGFLKLGRYRRFWNDSILVVAVPCGHVLYAQRVCNLEIKRNYNVETDFERFEDVFKRISSGDITDFTSKAVQIIKKQSK